jgi:integrase
MLSAKKVAKLKVAGRYHDAGGPVAGLYLQVSDTGAKSWLLRYEVNGRERMLGLGSTRTFSLKEARERARAARQKLADGIDPVDAKRAAKAAAAVQAAKALTFAEAADKYFDQHAAKWDNQKHREQFIASMRSYVFPVIGSLPVNSIDTPLILKVLEQPHAGGSFWTTRPETASRVRNRIENVLDWARVRGFRAGDNPAKWKGYLDQVLPARRQLDRGDHHAAMSYAEVPTFMAELAIREGVAAKALAFLILAAARTSEVTGARWSEIDFDNATWTLPAARMKARKEHKVPLSQQAVDLLRGLYTEDEFVYIGNKAGAALSDTAMAVMLKRMGRSETIHGFRSAFRTWAAERTSFPREVAEASLAHSIGSAVERAYQRTTLFDRRRRLMAEWATFVTTPVAGGEVVALRGRS